MVNRREVLKSITALPAAILMNKASLIEKNGSSGAVLNPSSVAISAGVMMPASYFYAIREWRAGISPAIILNYKKMEIEERWFYPADTLLLKTLVWVRKPLETLYLEDGRLNPMFSTNYCATKPENFEVSEPEARFALLKEFHNYFWGHITYEWRDWAGLSRCRVVSGELVLS